MSDKKTQKVQTIVTDYHRFILEGLVGIQGGSVSDVLSSILTSYVENNLQLLKDASLSIGDFREFQKNKEG